MPNERLETYRKNSSPFGLNDGDAAMKVAGFPMLKNDAIILMLKYVNFLRQIIWTKPVYEKVCLGKKVEYSRSMHCLPFLTNF